LKYRFSGFTVNTEAREVHRQGEIVELAPQTYDLLIFLLENHDRAIGKDELQNEVWGTIVTDSAMARGVMKLRKALDDTSESIIKTMPRFGYRFVAQLDTSGPPNLVAKPSMRGKTAAVIVGIAVLVIAVLVLRPSTTDLPRSVAVLPFDVMSNGENDEHFADGLTEEILNALTQLPELLVTARTSSFYFKDKAIPMPEIASILGVEHVVEGSVRRDGDMLRITAQLIRASDGFHLWSKTYDRNSVGVLDVQAEIAGQIAETLGVVLDSDKRDRMLATGLQNAEAYIAYQKGLELYDRAHGDPQRDVVLGEANRYFERTMELAPNFWGAHYLHSDQAVHRIAGYTDDNSEEGISESMIADADEQLQSDLRKAMTLAPDDAKRRGVDLTLSFITGRWRSIPEKYRGVLDDIPCESNNWISTLMLPFGSADIAVATSKVQRECDPLNWAGWQDGVQAALWLGEHEEALRIARVGARTIPLKPVREALVFALAANGHFEEAEDYLEINEADQRRRYRIGFAIAAARGDTEKAQSLFDAYEADPGPGTHLYVAYLSQQGRQQRADDLAAMIDQRPFGYLTLVTNVYYCICGAPFDIQRTPNFAARLEEAGFAWPPPSTISWPSQLKPD